MEKRIMKNSMFEPFFCNVVRWYSGMRLNGFLLASKKAEVYKSLLVLIKVN
jgi:hypothetical protein